MLSTWFENETYNFSKASENWSRASESWMSLALLGKLSKKFMLCPVSYSMNWFSSQHWARWAKILVLLFHLKSAYSIISPFPQVDIMDALFKEHKDHVPLYKNQPPVGGAIYWERSLFQRIKHTIIRFQTMDDMMTSEQGKAVSKVVPNSECVYMQGLIQDFKNVLASWNCQYDIIPASLCFPVPVES